jgi:translocation and assembly module TamA
VTLPLGRLRLIRPGAAVALLLVLLLAAPGPAQEPQEIPYVVEIAPTGNGALDEALAEVSRLVQLREEAPTTAFGIVSRAAEDLDRLARALHSEGYWGGTLRILIAGLPLGTPDLADRLEAVAARPVPVRIIAEPGPRYTIASVTLRADSAEGAAAVAAIAEEPFGLAPGDPARAEPILAAERRLLDRLLAAGHPLATVARRETVVDFDRRSMEVTWILSPGPAAVFAAPVVEGAERVDRAFLTRFAARLAGEPYSPRRLERARREMMGLGAFASVSARTAERLDEAGRLPVTFVVSERPRRAIGVSAAYETNFGPTFRLYWEHRNLFGRAENLRLEGEVARLGTAGRLVEDTTYRAFATLRAPGLFGRDLALIGTLGALRERLDAYDRDAVLASALVERRLTERLTLRAGPTAEFGSVGPPGGPLRPYQTVGLLFGGRWDSTDSLLDPARGWRLDGTVTPSWSIREAVPFAPLRLTATTYRDLFGDRRSILALRGTVGSLLNAGQLEVPQHQRFFAGGGGSVRGYDFQSIGPRDAAGRPLGGASLLELSAEWRQRLTESWGAAAFVDAGTVGSGLLPDTSELRLGVGLGARYYTVIGPIRADVALPLVRQRGSSGWGFYIGIGQAF